MMEIMVMNNNPEDRHVKVISFETNIPRCYKFEQYVLTLEIDGETVKFGNDFAEDYGCKGTLRDTPFRRS